MSIAPLLISIKKIWRDNVIRLITVSMFFLSSIFCMSLSVFLGVLIFSLFIIGCIVSTLLLNNREKVAKVFQKTKDIFGYKEYFHDLDSNCDVCGITKCARHRASPSREPWKGLIIDKNLDLAIEQFYSRILNSFVKSWFSLLSKDENFIYSLKHGLREASCRLIKKIKDINAPMLLSNKLLPCYFGHYEIITKMLSDGVPMDRLSMTFVHNEYAIHPAVINRQSELEYLRGVAKCLIPRLFTNEQFDSKVFFSLIRELIAGWVLLPLLDVISDPNLINLLVIVVTNPRLGNGAKLRTDSNKVVFLENFVRKKIEIPQLQEVDLLSDQTKLYSFMQFLKKEGAVDVLRFYLDVDNLNHELLDPRVTTDPAKLSSLYQQSEKLLSTYQTMMRNNFDVNEVSTLTEAHEEIKASLQGKWRRAFYKTSEYFRLVYGSREIKEATSEAKNLDHNIGPVSKFSSKLKGAIRGAVDGAPLEGAEVPTVWDAFSEPQISSSNNTIYSSVTQKLRKERGQNLDNFMINFMQSIEQSTDIGEDVIMMKDCKSHKKPPQLGRNLVFGDLFELKSAPIYLHSSSLPINTARGPSQCIIYILVRILNAPIVIVRLVLAFINVSKKFVDFAICVMFSKLINIGLHEPRLANLIYLLEEQIFDIRQPEPLPTELLDRQQLARFRLEAIRKNFGTIIDTLQSPALNKHLIYCLFDIILAEMYPEMDQLAKD